MITCTFEDSAGYDCISDGWRIEKGDKLIAIIDEADFESKAEAEYWARLITARLS